MKRTIVRMVGAAAMAAALGVGCSQTTATSMGGSAPAPAMTTSGTKAAGLRSALNSMLQEHVYLAAAATGAALGGRDAEFKAAASALDQNSIAISKAIGSVYGMDAERAFLPLWRRHIGFAVDYTVGVATSDKTKSDKAVSDLIGYTEDFGAFLASANPNLPKNVVAGLVKHHVVTLKDIIDAQASRATGRRLLAYF